MRRAWPKTVFYDVSGRELCAMKHSAASQCSLENPPFYATRVPNKSPCQSLFWDMKPQHRPPPQRQDLAPAKLSAPPRRKGGRQASAHPTAQASRSSSPVSPPSHPVASSAGSASAPVTVGVTLARFETLVSQVAQLTEALAAQQQAYATLQEQLKASLAESADLRLRLRPSKSKRSRSASASTPNTPADRSGSEPSMSSGEEEPAPRRHSTGRRTPTNA